MDFSSLNKNQTEAVRKIDGPLLIVAGAGTGKTRVLTNKIAYLIDEIGVSPNNILAFTFTNKAADEIKKRVTKSIGESTIMNWIGTYHAICMKILKIDGEIIGVNNRFNIVDVADQVGIIKTIFKSSDIGLNELKPRKCVSIISDLKSNELNINDMSELKFLNRYGLTKPQTYNIVRFAFKKYHEVLAKNKSLDFDDLILKTIKLFREHPEFAEKWSNRFHYVLVDEFQDTSFLQLELIKFLVNPEKNLVFAVGDPNQTIYTFRGAYPRIFSDFVDEFGDVDVVNLNQNYRSSDKIISVANNLIKHNDSTFKNMLQANFKSNDNVVVYNAPNLEFEAKFIVDQIEKLSGQDANINLNDIAVLYRSNYISRALEEAFMKTGIKYQMIGSVGFYERKEIKDIISYLKAIVYNDDVSLERIINIPKRSIGEASINIINDYCIENKKSFYDAIDNIDLIQKLSNGAKNKIKEFNRLIKWFKEKFKEIDNGSEMIDLIIDKINYEDYLKSFEIDITHRLENINELKNAVNEYQKGFVDFRIEDFLQNISLYSTTDAKNEKNTVKLMTIHATKGLEFKYVFIFAFNDGIIPSKRAMDESLLAIEEERRIAYVAITRAIKQLFITNTAADSESLFSFNRNTSSRFIKEFGRNGVEIICPTAKSISDYDLEYFNSKKIKIDVNKMYSEDDVSFSIGDVISHVVFGSGTVVGVDGIFIDVIFKAPTGKQRLIAKHKSIKRIVS